MITTLELFQTLIRNACVNDGTIESGQEVRSVRTLQGYFGVAGEVFEPAPGRMSLIYRIPGSIPGAPSLGFAPHLDVVPAEPSGWSVDPFAAEIIDGLVYGRGAVDMLNLTASMAAAVRPYVTGELVPTGDLIFCALADEEAGGVLGAAPLVEDHWDLIGCDFLLTELAYPALPGHPPRVPVSVGEKGSYWSHLVTTGTPGHGSAPYGSDNAISKLARALVGIMGSPAPAAITSDWLGFMGALGLEGALEEALGDPDTLDRAIEDIAASDPALARFVHAATHLTISPNVIVGGSKANVIPDTAQAQVDIRALPGMDRAFVDSHLRKAMGSAADHVEIRPFADNPANTSPVGNRLWEAIADTVEDLEGHRSLVPVMSAAATDGRFWRARGTVVHGVGLFGDAMSFTEMLTLFHGHDERVPAAAIDRSATLYQGIIERFMTTE